MLGSLNFLPSTSLSQPRRCIFISDDHGDAIQAWIQSAKSAPEGSSSDPMTVLHVDAHNDLNVPASHFSHAVHAGGASIAAAVDLANFQLSAVWAGLISRVVWVRQSDARAPCSHTVSRLVLASSGEFEDEPLSLSEDYDQLSERATWAVGGDAGVTYAYHEVPEHHLEAFEPAHALVRALLLNASAYIVDIDLDFFVHGDARPGRSPGFARSAFPLLDGQIRRLETLLASVAHAKHLPVAVTIARSTQGYTRAEDVPRLEAAVLAMLERVYGRACITYSHGVSEVYRSSPTLTG
jgi:hypothetical protein